MFYLFVPLSSQYFLQDVFLAVETQMRFRGEHEQLKFCSIWCGCVQAHLIVVSLCAWPVVLRCAVLKHQSCSGYGLPDPSRRILSSWVLAVQ